MTQTLRRELRKNIGAKIDAYLEEKNGIIDWGTIYDIAADAALEIRGFALLGKYTMTIENSVVMGQTVTAEQVQDASIRDKAPKMFEAALGISKPLPWYSGGKDWSEFLEWVIERYGESKTSFGEYNIWRNGQYVKGSLSNVKIRNNVKDFYDSWDMFVMAKGRKTDETAGNYQTDAELEQLREQAKQLFGASK